MKCPYNKIIQKTETDGYQCRTTKITVQFDDCIGKYCPFYEPERDYYCRKVEAECKHA